MEDKEIIILAEKELEEIKYIKNRINSIEYIFKMNEEIENIEKLKIERYNLKIRLERIISAISTLGEENQKIICYRYFDKLKFNEIKVRINSSERRMYSLLKRSKLTIGKILFGDNNKKNKKHL